MKPLVRFGIAALAGVVAFAYLPANLRSRLKARAKDRMMRACEDMMARLPEQAPPKLVISLLPKLHAQNEQILALLQEQNRLLREQQHSAR